MSGGYLDVELTGAGVLDTIRRANDKGIVLYNVRWTGDLCVKLSVPVSGYFMLGRLAAKQGDDISVIGRRGVRFWFLSMVNRPLMMLALAVLVWLSVWLPGRVLFIAVEGNETMNSALIMQTAEECGIYFGAKRAIVRSEAVKNRLLQKLPQLQWAGVNTYGCTAVISVREDLLSNRSGDPKMPGSIVAVRDGIVTSVTVTSGNAKCKIGDAVKIGDVLISGRGEEGILCRITRSEGEVFAQTNRAQTTVTPAVYARKRNDNISNRVISLLIGKKRINLSKDSGFYYAGYDKIYREYCVVLPGGYSLPLAFSVEEFYVCDRETVYVPETDALLLNTSDRYILDQMNAGRILSRNVQWEESGSACILHTVYVCNEMIGLERDEELEFINGQDRGTDR